VLGSRSVKDEDYAMSASETEERDVRIAIAVRATSQSLGWIGTEAGIFQRLGLNVMFPAMETAAVEAVAGLVRGEWDFVEVGGPRLSRVSWMAMTPSCSWRRNRHLWSAAISWDAEMSPRRWTCVADALAS
jgi:hypothetical protein